MTTILFIAALIVFTFIAYFNIVNRSKPSKSVDLPEADIHEEIAKTVETIKAQEPVVDTPPTEKSEAKPKRKSAPRKTTNTPKIKSKK